MFLIQLSSIILISSLKLSLLSIDYVAAADQNPIAVENQSDQLTNRLIDNAIYRITNYSNIDPYHLHKEYQLELHHQLGLVPFDFCFSNCHVGILNGTLFGLSRMYRCSNGTFDNDENRDLVASFVLCVDNIALGSNLTFSFGPLELFNMPVRSYVGELQIKLILLVRGKVISLRYLRVRKIERVRLRFTGPSSMIKDDGIITNDLLDSTTNLILEYFNKFARKVLSRALFEILTEEIKFMQGGEDKQKQ